MTAATISAACRPAFARHETFHPRYGWLRKAFLAAQRGGDSFTRPSAPVDLGVGKNMVNAIRYWGLAYKVIEERQDPTRPRLPGAAPSAFGVALLSDDGWDPYLEDEASLWLLHWMLLRTPCSAPTWWIAFNLFPSQHWDEDALTRYAASLVASLPAWPEIVESSIRKDVSCLVRTFSPRRVGRLGLDDVIDCPFRELHLVDGVAGDAQSFRFPHGHKANLPDEVVAFAALDFASVQSGAARSISIPTLARHHGSPGQAFKISEDFIHSALSRVASGNWGLHVAEPAGLRQLLFDSDPGPLARKILAAYFRRVTGSKRRLDLPGDRDAEVPPVTVAV